MPPAQVEGSRCSLRWSPAIAFAMSAWPGNPLLQPATSSEAVRAKVGFARRDSPGDTTRQGDDKYLRQHRAMRVVVPTPSAFSA